MVSVQWSGERREVPETMWFQRSCGCGVAKGGFVLLRLRARPLPTARKMRQEGCTPLLDVGAAFGPIVPRCSEKW